MLFSCNLFLCLFAAVNRKICSKFVPEILDFIPLLWYFKGEIPLNSLWYFRPNTRYFRYSRGISVIPGISRYSRVFQPNLEFWNTPSDKLIFQFDYEILTSNSLYGQNFVSQKYKSLLNIIWEFTTYQSLK